MTIGRNANAKFTKTVTLIICVSIIILSVVLIESYGLSTAIDTLTKHTRIEQQSVENADMSFANDIANKFQTNTQTLKVELDGFLNPEVASTKTIQELININTTLLDTQSYHKYAGLPPLSSNGELEDERKVLDSIGDHLGRIFNEDSQFGKAGSIVSFVMIATPDCGMYMSEPFDSHQQYYLKTTDEAIKRSKPEWCAIVQNNPSKQGMFLVGSYNSEANPAERVFSITRALKRSDGSTSGIILVAFNLDKVEKALSNGAPQLNLTLWSHDITRNDIWPIITIMDHNAILYPNNTDSAHPNYKTLSESELTLIQNNSRDSSISGTHCNMVGSDNILVNLPIFNMYCVAYADPSNQFNTKIVSNYASNQMNENKIKPSAYISRNWAFVIIDRYTFDFSFYLTMIILPMAIIIITLGAACITIFVLRYFFNDRPVYLPR